MQPTAVPGDTPNRSRRADWLAAALDLLSREGIEQVKIQRLAQILGTARSSFYWAFDSRKALMTALLDQWADKNTGAIVRQAALPADSITTAVLNVFECWIDPTLFDAKLDFAIREWARRDPEILSAIDAADDRRLTALTDMFRRYYYPQQQALIRARILYFTQIGYFALTPNESLQDRHRHVNDYIIGFTGQAPTKAEGERFNARLADIAAKLDPAEGIKR